MKKILLFFIVLTAYKTAFSQQAKRPNIVIILADDLGWGDLGFHGSDIHTPNIDRLANEGLVMNQFYTAPICSPTRAGLMTGRYPNRFGLRHNVIPPWSRFGVDTSEIFLPAMLKKAGYKNRAAIGKWHLGAAYKKFLPLQRGFTHFYGFYNGAFDYFTHQREGELDWHNDEAVSYDTGYSTDLITREAVKCIHQYAGKSPFFVYVAYNAPHGPLQAKKEDLLRYGFDENKPLFPHKGAYGQIGRGNNKRQTYSAMVTCMDMGVGQILQALKDMHIDDNTLVLFLSDNGAQKGGGGSSGALRGWKFQEWDGGVRSPAIIRWPAGFKGKRVINQVSGYVDVMPTLLNIASVSKKPKKPFDGINILPVLKGKVKQIDRYFYLGYGSIIHGPWKLVTAHAGNSAMKAQKDLLFNILKDSTEHNNVIAQHPEIYQDLQRAVLPFDEIKPAHEVPPYGQGRKGFVAPKDWIITK
jgi:arylsulfatase B